MEPTNTTALECMQGGATAQIFVISVVDPAKHIIMRQVLKVIIIIT